MDYLQFLETKDYAKGTITTYKKRLKFFSKNRERFKKLRYSKNYYSQLKSALILYHENKDCYNHKDIDLIKKFVKEAKKKPKKMEEPFKLKNINCRINALHDKRLKLAFRLQEISGLRISEIHDLTKEDLTFLDNYRILVNVRFGKGMKQRILQTLKDMYVWKELQNLKERKGKLFYSVIKMQKEAARLGFHTHDLRKVFAQVIYYKKADIELLKRLLGHTKASKTYLKYINREINFTGTSLDI